MPARAILLVEDDPAHAELLATALELRGLPGVVTVASDAEAAFRALAAAHPLPALVVLDLGLPAIDGLRILTVLGANPAWQGIPRVVLSGSLRPEDRTLSRQLGACAHLVKPPTLDGMLGVADRLIALAGDGLATASAPLP